MAGSLRPREGRHLERRHLARPRHTPAFYPFFCPSS
jgi:hypothetical protein